jgi:hypothetical protein
MDAGLSGLGRDRPFLPDVTMEATVAGSIREPELKKDH